jgi:hypothetical protein
MDLSQKLRERPTPKFSEAVASCAGANVSRTHYNFPVQGLKSLQLHQRAFPHLHPIAAKARSVYKHLLTLGLKVLELGKTLYLLDVLLDSQRKQLTL